MALPTANNGAGIDPVQYGMLLASVESLKSQQSEMKQDMDVRLQRMTEQIDNLLELANQSKGGLWAGMTVAATLGSVVTWAAKDLFGGRP
jgi:hypothetical protein